MVICRALRRILSNRNAPKPERMMERTIEGSRQLLLRTPLPMNGNEPPPLIKCQSQHIRCNGDVGFDAQGNHDWNRDQRCAARHDADYARKEED